MGLQCSKGIHHQVLKVILEVYDRESSKALIQYKDVLADCWNKLS